MNEGTYLPGFFLNTYRKLLVEFYGNHLHNNDWTQMDEVVTYNDLWQSHWKRLTAYLDRWYEMLFKVVGRRFMARLEEEWLGV